MDSRDLIELTAHIVSTYVGHHQTRASDLPDMISAVHASLARVEAPPPVQQPEPEIRPAVSVRKSISPDYLICLEDGRKFISLKRHLMSAYGLTPDEYRAKWGLPNNYPMVAPAYAAKRSELAKAIGLGNARRTSPETADRTRAPAKTDIRASMPPEEPIELGHTADAEAPKQRRRAKKAV